MSGRGTALAAATAGAAGFTLCAALVPLSALQGWIIAAMAWSGIPLGSLVLVLAGVLTGGRWRDALGPVLVPASRLVPLAGLALLPTLLDPAAIFPWMRSAAGVAPDVGSLYLDPTLMLARSVAALGGLSLLSILPGVRASRLMAGLGLVFSAVTLSVFAVDWILSLEPATTSSAFPATIVVQEVLAALGACALALAPTLAERDRADLAGLLLTALLGVVYLALMAFIVAWYGNLPAKAAWYLRRADGGWEWTLLAALAIGFAGPFLVLLSDRARHSATMLRAAGGGVLAGVALHTAWLMAPVFGWPCMIPAAFGLLGLAGLSWLLGASLFQHGEPVHA